MANDFDSRIIEQGKKIYELMEGATPSIFNKDWWQGRIMEYSMNKEDFKVEMFRFVDVLPVLKTPVMVARHLQEYFCRPDQNFPTAFQWGLKAVSPTSIVAKKAAQLIEKNIKNMAHQFIAGTTGAEAVDTITKLRKSSMGFTVDLLGEATVSDEEADVYQKRYLELIESLSTSSVEWEPVPILDQDDRGPIPRVNISIKMSSLFSQIDPIDFAGSLEATKNQLRPIFQLAKSRKVAVNLDLEQFIFRDITFAVFKALMEEPEFKDFEHAGVVIQAYLQDSEKDAQDIIKWAKKKKKRITVRLVKGAYWDYETVIAEQNGWPSPVFLNKWESDASYERISELLLKNTKNILPAFASHNVRSLAHAIILAEKLKVPKNAFEIQTLYGMAEPLRVAISQLGFRLRVYLPVGEMIPGMAYLVRRLLENTSNESFLRQSFVDGVELERLLENPVQTLVKEKPVPKKKGEIGPFDSHPPTDFSLAENRIRFEKAFKPVEKAFGTYYPLIINNKKVKTENSTTSTSPSNPDIIIGEVAKASRVEADMAIKATQDAFPAWRDSTPETRARLLLKAADIMRKQSHELSALMVHEEGKNWREADGDTCEAIDFFEYYAREAIRLGEVQKLGNKPGELNHYFYQARGTVVVIAPWNFPLAILTGMTTGALAAGCTVIMKPASQSPVIAAKLMEILKSAGFPPGVVNFLPCSGRDVGAYLVTHPDIHMITFTGSMEVGLEMIRQAYTTKEGQTGVKKVIAEMGGKNGIIIDDDADLDEAVMATVKSAFGYQGQKCSACSRVIVLKENYDEFVHRLLEATKSLVIGPGRDPKNLIGPVIDAGAHRTISEYIEIGKKECTLALQRTDVPDTGYFVGPTIFVDVEPHHRIAQEEIFGPVLAVLKAENLDEALEIANGTNYALTGGLISRSPGNIERVRKEFRVGNLYINQGSTGALVGRQPFGGFKMSGIGSKAGGPDYVPQFLEPRTITENTMRRGFTPVDE